MKVEDITVTSLKLVPENKAESELLISFYTFQSRLFLCGLIEEYDPETGLHSIFIELEDA